MQEPKIDKEQYSAFTADLSYKYILLQYGLLFEQYLADMQKQTEQLRRIAVQLELIENDLSRN